MKEPVPELTGTMSRAGAFKQDVVRSPPEVMVDVLMAIKWNHEKVRDLVISCFLSCLSAVPRPSKQQHDTQFFFCFQPSIDISIMLGHISSPSWTRQKLVPQAAPRNLGQWMHAPLFFIPQRRGYWAILACACCTTGPLGSRMQLSLSVLCHFHWRPGI